MPRYKVHYTADVWEYVVIEADSAKKAQELFETQGEGYEEAVEDVPEQMGMENVKVDVVEEIKQNQRMVPHQPLSHLKNYKGGTTLGYVSHRMCMPSSHDPA